MNVILKRKLSNFNTSRKDYITTFKGRHLLNKQQSRWWCHLASFNDTTENKCNPNPNPNPTKHTKPLFETMWLIRDGVSSVGFVMVDWSSFCSFVSADSDICVLCSCARNDAVLVF